MNDYSIELAAERICDSRTKSYFHEVFSSYSAGNYRSATVMLWSVVISDLIYKLQHLRDTDNDSTASDILTAVQNRQNLNPKNPDWEDFLLNEVKERTELIDEAGFVTLDSLHKIRHLSAHPVLSNVDLLFNPSKEQVRAFIRTALDDIFLKPPIFTKKVIDEFVTDLASKKDIFPSDNSLKRYIEAKYFNRLNPTIENRLFRSLWKFVFNLDNPDAQANRAINYRCLSIIFNRRHNELKEYIREDRTFFSRITQGSPLNSLIHFLNDNPSLFHLLSAEAHIIIEDKANSNINWYSFCTFLSDSVEAHLQKLIKKIESSAHIYVRDENAVSPTPWRRVLTLAEENECFNLAKKIGISSYTKSGSFYTADVFFDRFILPLKDSLNESDLIELLDRISLNDQTYYRGKAYNDHRILREVCEKVLPRDFDYSKYDDWLPKPDSEE